MLGNIASRFRDCFLPAKFSSTSYSRLANPGVESPRASAESSAHGSPFSGTRPGSASDGIPNFSTEPESGLKPKEEKLAGYLLARAAMHRKVEGPVLKNLRAGHATVQEVRELLPLGRANVVQDIEKSEDPRLMLRIRASHQLRNALKPSERCFFRSEPKNADNWRHAAAGLYIQTGTCGTHAVVTAPVHAAKLPGMKNKQAVVAKADHNTIDHGWAEMMPNGMGKDGKPILHGEDVIMDGWSKEDVAILREDGAFSRLGPGGSRDHISHSDIMNHETGPEALKSVEKYKARIENSRALKLKYESELQRLDWEGHEVPKEFFWNATSVFSSDFRNKAAEALHPNTEKAKLEMMTEIQAVGVARSLGSNIRGAKAEAPGIIAAAENLFTREGYHNGEN